jgi:hypothetical protein
MGSAPNRTLAPGHPSFTCRVEGWTDGPIYCEGGEGHARCIVHAAPPPSKTPFVNAMVYESVAPSGYSAGVACCGE